MRIIAENLDGDWSAWKQSDRATSFSSGNPVMAVIGLCNELGLDRSRLAPDRDACRSDHLEFVYGASCPDCRGTGRYVGLNTIDDCEACGGLGYVNDE